MKYYECESGKLLCGDVLEEMKQLKDISVDCVITSPPYWQLRDYGYPDQWGLEPTYQEYLEHLRLFMREVWRVLKDDGTVWVNLGDTYARGGRNKDGTNHTTMKKSKEHRIEPNTKPDYGGKDKCLLLIPHRFAINCIDDGWIMRNDIIWAKRNGMPESVTDRFSKKHEYFFFMVKSQKYYFDLDDVRDKQKKSSIKRCKTPYYERDLSDSNVSSVNVNTEKTYREKVLAGMGKNPGSVSDFWDIQTKPSKSKHYASFNTDLIDKPIIAGCPEGGVILDPFNGTGTTILRAEQLNRKWIGIDGSEEYCEISKARIKNELIQTKINFD